MSIDTLQRDPTLVDRIVAALGAEIEAGALAPGARLPQDAVAQRFRASHVPVREAFRRLEALELVVSRPRRGVVVARIDAAAHHEALEMRAALEPLALLHAFGRYGPGHLARLAAADAACGAAPEAEAWAAANAAFHGLLLAPCPMPGLMAEIARLRRRAALGARDARPRPLTLPREDRDHRAILNALHAGEPERAGRVLALHIRRGHLGGS